MITITDKDGEVCAKLDDLGAVLVWMQNKTIALINEGAKSFEFEARDANNQPQISVTGYPTLGENDTLMFPSVRWDFHWLENAQSEFSNGGE